MKNFFGAFHHEYRNEEIELYIEGGAVSANKEYSSVVSEGIQSRFVRIIAENVNTWVHSKTKVLIEVALVTRDFGASERYNQSEMKVLEMVQNENSLFEEVFRSVAFHPDTVLFRNQDVNTSRDPNISVLFNLQRVDMKSLRAYTSVSLGDHYLMQEVSDVLEPNHAYVEMTEMKRSIAHHLELFTQNSPPIFKEV